MLRLQILFVFLVFVSLSPVLSNAATIGAYADADGTSWVAYGTNYNGDTVEVDGYIIVEAEDLINAVGYRLDVRDEGHLAFRVSNWYGPDGDGLGVSTANGESVGLGGCYPGFNSIKIVVAHYRYILLHGWPSSRASTAPERLGRGPIPVRFMTVYPNPDADPGNPDAQLFPVYSNCRGGIIPLIVTNELLTYETVATESQSFGAVKALALPTTP